MTPSPALDAALALARTPTLAAAMRRRPLPAGVADLLRLAAGDAAALADAARLTGHPESHLRAAVELYVQQVLLFAGAPAHRTLGVAPDAPRALARANLKQLMLWLHPDHNAADWRSAFAGRVLAAWRALPAAGAEADGAPEAAGGDAPLSPPSRISRRGRRPPRVTWAAGPPPTRRAGLRRAGLVSVGLLAAAAAAYAVAPPETLSSLAAALWEIAGGADATR